MARVTREERRRLRSREKQRETSRLRHDAGFFVAAFRRLVAKGWGPPGMEMLLGPDIEPEGFRAAVESICGSADVRPGSPGSWGFLASILEEIEAPPEEILWVLEKWIHAHPGDPAPHVLRVRRFLVATRIDEMFTALERAAASPAGSEFLSRLEQDCVRAGESFKGLMEHFRAWQVETRRTPWPRGPQPAVRGAMERERGRRQGTTAVPGRIRRVAPSGPVSPCSSTPQASPHGAPAPLSFVSIPGRSLLDRLASGPHDDLEGHELACRAVEVLAEDQYDRLLSLPALRGVERYSHQLETVLRVLKRFRGRVLLADEVGLGKTIEACVVLKEYMARGQVRRALILTPPALVGQWRAELAEKFSISTHTTLDSGFRRDPEGFWSSGPVLIASLALARSAAHRERVLRERFDLVIVDEAHHLKNRATRGWELVNGIRSRFFLMLTATPVENNLTELYNLVTLLRPGTLGTEGEFRRRFVRSGDPSQPRDPEKLRELLREVMVRNTRATCGVALPPRTVKTVIIRPTTAEEALYQLVLEATRRLGLGHRTLFRLLIEEAGSSPGAVMRTARRAREDGPSGDLLVELARIEEAAAAVGATAKMDRLRALLAGGKVLVFSRFRSTLEDLARRFEDWGTPFVSFHGDQSAAERNEAVEAFARPGADVMLCSEIGGEGRNLQFCHRLVNFDLPWNPMKIEQRIGRIHRIGQLETVEVTNLAGSGTAEERILDVLDRRINLFELVVGEMDLLLGDLTDEREFGDQVYDIYARSRGEEEVGKGFDELAAKLLEGRGRLERMKALDEALFGEGYEA